MFQHYQIMAKEHYNDWNKNSNNQHCYNCFRKFYESYQNKSYKKKKMGGRKNDKMITQPLCTKLLSTKKHEQLKLETNILQER